MSRREEEPREPRQPGEELSDAHVRRMLRSGDSDRERPQKKDLAEVLRALFATLRRHPLWTVLGVVVVVLSIVATLWQLLPRDKNSELLDALTRHEHELLDQRAGATSSAEIARIDAALDQVRKKEREVIDRMSRDEDPTSTPEEDPIPARDIAHVAEEERVPQGQAREGLDAERDAAASGSAAGAERGPSHGAAVGGPRTRHGAADASGQGGGGARPDGQSGGGLLQQGKTSTSTAPGAPTDGPVVPPGAPDAPGGPAELQCETWIHNGVLRLTLETPPLRGERPRDLVRRHRELVNELQRWLPGG